MVVVYVKAFSRFRPKCGTKVTQNIICRVPLIYLYMQYHEQYSCHDSKGFRFLPAELFNFLLLNMVGVTHFTKFFSKVIFCVNKPMQLPCFISFFVFGIELWHFFHFSYFSKSKKWAWS